MIGYRDRFVRVGVLDLHYLDWGDPANPAVVLLHGGGQNCHAWDHTAEVLAERFRVIVPDCRNHGDSGFSAGPYTYSDLADDILAIADRLGIGVFGLIGHSMGGHQAMTLAGSHPNRLRWLVIEDSPPSTPTSVAANQRRAATQLTGEFDTFAELRAFTDRALIAASEEYRQEKALFSRRHLREGRFAVKWIPGATPTSGGIDLWEHVTRITCPTLVVWGRESQILDEATAQRMVQTLPSARLAAISPAAHLVHEDQPAQFNAAVLAFVDSLA